MTYLTAILGIFGNSLKQLGRTGLLVFIVPFILLILLGTAVYARLEGWTIAEALYVTIITITTVGYGDLSPQTPAGRTFAIFFTLIAIGLAGYALSTVAAVIFDGQQAKIERKRLERRMKKIADLTDHIIVCGGDILGTRAAKEFARRNQTFVIIEADEAKLKRTLLWMHEVYVDKRQRHYSHLDEVDLSIEENMSIAELADETGVLYMQEDPTDEQQLRAAGVHRAAGVVAAMPDDRDNTTIILGSRDMARRLGNDKLRIVASAMDEQNMHTLYLAGADRVISPNIMGGFTVATQMLDPDAAEFWDQMLYQLDKTMRIGDMKVNDHPDLIGRTVNDIRQSHHQLVIAIRRAGQFIHAPEPAAAVQKDDALIVMGPHLD